MKMEYVDANGVKRENVEVTKPDLERMREEWLQFFRSIGEAFRPLLRAVNELAESPEFLAYASAAAQEWAAAQEQEAVQADVVIE